MCRFVDAGWAVGRTLCRPRVWLPLLTWALLTVLAYRFIPVMPMHRFDLGAANRTEEDDPQRTWSVIAIAPDGDSLVCTRPTKPDVLAPPPRVRALMDLGPIKPIEEARLWNIKSGSMNSIPADGEYFSPKVPWQAVHTPAPREKTTYTHFVHRDTGKKSASFSGSYIQSPSGRLVVYTDGNANHLIDLEADKPRHFFVAPTIEQTALVPFFPRCFSGDERLLAGVAKGVIVIVEVQSGRIVKTIDYGGPEDHSYPSTMTFSPDGQALLWEFGRSVYVSDLTANRERIEVPEARFIGWQPFARVLLKHRDSFLDPTRRLEIWNWRENRVVGEWELPESYHLVIGHMKSWAARPETYVAQSPGGRHILFAGYVENAKSSPWFAKLREWMGKPEERGIHLEVFVLDGDDLTLRHHWQIPAQRHRDVMLQFTSDNRYLVFTDEHTVEHWPVPPRSWVTSALRAGGATLVLALPIVLWRYWRGRKKQKAATALPQEGAA